MTSAVLKKKILQSLFTMAEVVEARDPYTGGHLWRVSQFSRLLAQKTGLDARGVVQAALGGFLHDLGKVSIPDGILNKPGRLTENEYDVIKTHPTIGAELIDQHPLASLVKEAIELHHERPDGRGYPYGKESVPVIARVVSIADAFDAMTSTRPYRKGMPTEQAVEIIKEFNGTQFDATLATDFIELVEAGLLNSIVGHTSEGIPLLDCPVCGPTLHIHKGQQQGEPVFCRKCNAGFTVDIKDGKYGLLMAEGQGETYDKHTVADIEVILDLVSEVLSNLTIDGEIDVKE
ncbi:MAG: HD domain-containing protein [Mariprofundaceae bacterium]